MKNIRHSNLYFIKSDKFWIALGIILVLIGFILAHLSNANVIHWSNGNEHIAHIIFHIIGPILIFLGLLIALVKKLKK